jgi:hypothetical protein
MFEERKYSLFNPNSRVTTIFIAIAHFIIIAVGFFTFITYQNTSANLLIQQDSQLAFLSAIRLNGELLKFAEELNTLARDPVILSDVFIERNRKFQSYENRLAVFDGGTILLSNEGKVQTSISVESNLVGADWSEFDFFSAQLNTPGLFLSNAITFPHSTSEVVVLSVPLITSENEFKGVLAGMFKIGATSVSSFYASIVKLRLGLTGSTYLLDGQNRILYDSATLTSRSLSEISHLDFLDFSASSGAYRTRDEQGNQIIAAYSSVPDTKWKLVIEDDWNIITAPVRPYQNTILGFLGFGMILPAISVAILSRMRSREEQRITSRAEENKIADDLVYRLSTINPPYVHGWDFFFRPTANEPDILLMQDIFVTDRGRLVGNFAYQKKDGISSALMLHQIKTVIHSAFHNQESLKKAVETANKLVFTHISEVNPISLFCVEIDPVNGSAEYINLGFEGAYQFDDNLATPQPVEITQQGLGSGLELHCNSHEFRFEQGSNFLLLVPDKAYESASALIHNPSLNDLLLSRELNNITDIKTHNSQQQKTDLDFSVIILHRNDKV